MCARIMIELNALVAGFLIRRQLLEVGLTASSSKSQLK